MSLKIKVIAPAFGVKTAQKRLEQATTLLKAKDIELIVNKKIFIDAELPFFASSLQHRQNDLIEAIESRDCNIIWAFRGGYGSNQLIEKCLEVRPTIPKILIGFSDITALLLLFTQYYNLPSIHGNVVTSWLSKNYDFDSFLQLLKGGVSNYEIYKINNASIADKLTAPIIGGNLTVLNSLIGTKMHPQTNNKILLLEDVDEKGYAIYRSLNHMLQAGLLEKVQGILFGDFTEGDELVWPAIEHFCRAIIPAIPCFRINGIGHGEYNRPIILGTPADILEGKVLRIKSPFNFL